MNTFNSLLGLTKSRHTPPLTPDKRYEPIQGDDIDELVNWQIEQGREQRR